MWYIAQRIVCVPKITCRVVIWHPRDLWRMRSLSARHKHDDFHFTAPGPVLENENSAGSRCHLLQKKQNPVIGEERVAHWHPTGLKPCPSLGNRDACEMSLPLAAALNSSLQLPHYGSGHHLSPSFPPSLLWKHPLKKTKQRSPVLTFWHSREATTSS